MTNSNNVWGSGITEDLSRINVLQNKYFFKTASAKLFPFMFQPSDLVTLRLNSIYEDYQIGKILGEGFINFMLEWSIIVFLF